MSQILDYSLARPAPADIKSKGYVGVMRYLAPLIDAPKIITLGEYAALLAAGLQVGLNWEWYANRAREGAAAGESDATAAAALAKALGYTGAIYFSVDYDAPPEDQEAINEYFKACAQVIGLAHLGAYAGYRPLSALFNAGLITYGWQSDAWNYGSYESRAALLQTGATDFNGEADINDVLKSDWTGEAPPVDYKAQQAAATWGSTYPDNTGIHSAWLDAYVNHSIVGGPPIGAEFSTVDWYGAPIRCQYFANLRIEYYLATGENHGFTATTRLW